jgi:PAS domain S-box-containing protein
MNDELRILLVEDVSADAELIIRELRKANLAFVSRCVEKRDDFVSALKEFAPHLILSDFSLGQFDALEALRILKEEKSDLPFILVTGSQSEEVAVACIKEGADDYILKASLKRLPSAVISAIKKKEAERERGKALLALRRSMELFRSLIENSSDIITILGPDGTIAYESPSVERVLGYSPEALLGRNAFEFICPDDAKSVRAALAESGGLKISNPIEYRFRHKDGNWRRLETIGKNLLDDPAVAGIIINSRDVTERRSAEERIREQAALLDKAQDAILVHDLEGRIAYWNNGAERVYGFTAQEAIGKKMTELIGEQPIAPAEPMGNGGVETGEWHGELYHARKGGQEIVVESHSTLVRDNSGRPQSMLVINTDITERKKLETQFLRVQRMESIGTLASGIAHDLNNVLTPILMSIRMLKDEVKSGAAQEMLNTLETSTVRGSGIVQQVLSFARGVEGVRSVLQIKHPLTEVLSIARDTFPKSIQISCKLEKDLWTVVGDPTQLHQIFMNLFVNARDAMPHGGRLHVEAENVQIDENYARMQPEAHSGPYAVVSISDTGVGIPPGVIGKIFEPFFTTKEMGKGTGLGLSTTLGIVRSHGGFLTVYSEPGKGTRFKAYLPAADSAEHRPTSESHAEAPIGQGELILVADDEFAVREIVRVTLEAHNYQVATADDGTEALAVYAERRNEIKLVIVDVMMPYMDGPATMRALQRMNPGVKLIAVSGLMEKDRMDEFPDESRIAFLAKPFTTEQLLVTLRRLLDDR